MTGPTSFRPGSAAAGSPGPSLDGASVAVAAAAAAGGDIAVSAGAGAGDCACAGVLDAESDVASGGGEVGSWVVAAVAVAVAGDGGVGGTVVLGAGAAAGYRNSFLYTISCHLYGSKITRHVNSQTVCTFPVVGV